MLKLETNIKFLKGVGEKKAEAFSKELEINTVEDLIYYFPFRYIDRSKFYKINEISGEMPFIQLKANILSFHKIGQVYKERLVAIAEDETGRIELVWFKGIKWIENKFSQGKSYIIFGKPNLFNGKVNIVHPDLEEPEKFEKNNLSGFQGIYTIPEKLKKKYVSLKTLQNIIVDAFKIGIQIEETLAAELLNSLKLMPLQEALKQMHFPENPQKLAKAKYRIKFEELFYVQLNLVKTKKLKRRFKGLLFSKVGDNFMQFYKTKLPFELTNAQKRVMKEIRKDVGSGIQMNRLLQGDVGSGKTLIALLSMLLAIDNGFQTCLMAPTEILATQHFNTIYKFLESLGINIRILTGSTRIKQRRIIHEELLNGQLQILIGTHALVENVVQFKNLGFVVIDEQHRFGVAQRAKLWKKNTIPPHILVMTATPIPRTLAMTVYGDLEVSSIDELPPGRKAIKTIHATDAKRLQIFGFIRKEIAKGRQVYIVYPLIKESEKFDYKDLEDGYISITRAFPPPEYNTIMVHGKMKPADKEKAMQMFVKGQAHIMVATTVIEVGVDVPNASVMIIESAERFGLAQLHQLRGRVGRGVDQSFCILMTSYKLSKNSRIRINTMVNSSDGFEIAEVDLKLRGPGDIQGTQQSGIPFKFRLANLAEDSEILQTARSKAIQIIDKDPELELEEYEILREQLKKIKKTNFSWEIIS